MTVLEVTLVGSSIRSSRPLLHHRDARHACPLSAGESMNLEGGGRREEMHSYVFEAAGQVAYNYRRAVSKTCRGHVFNR